MNIFGQGVTGPAGMPLTREMREGGEQQTFRAQESFIPQAEPAPVQPTTTGNYFTPDEARSRYAQHLPIQATPNDVLLPSDDPRVYTYQMPNGDIYYLPAFEEQLAERRSVGQVIDLAMDSIPSRTEVESALLGAPRAIYDSINRQVTGQGTYEDIIGTAAGMVGTNTLPRSSFTDGILSDTPADGPNDYWDGVDEDAVDADFEPIGDWPPPTDAEMQAHRDQFEQVPFDPENGDWDPPDIPEPRPSNVEIGSWLVPPAPLREGKKPGTGTSPLYPPRDYTTDYATPDTIVFRSPVRDIVAGLQVPSQGIKGSQFIKMLQDNPSVRNSEISALDLGINPQARYTREELDQLVNSRVPQVEGYLTRNYESYQRQKVQDQELGYDELIIEATPQQGKGFRANNQHYGENTLAHTRISTREGPNGPYVLVEEMQSDLIQQGWQEPTKINSFTNYLGTNLQDYLIYMDYPEIGSVIQEVYTSLPTEEWLDVTKNAHWSSPPFLTRVRDALNRVKLPESIPVDSNVISGISRVIQDYADFKLFREVDSNPPIRNTQESTRLLVESLISYADQRGVNEIVFPPLERIVAERFRPGTEEYNKAMTPGSGFHQTYVTSLKKVLQELQTEFGRENIPIYRRELPYEARSTPTIDYETSRVMWNDLISMRRRYGEWFPDETDQQIDQRVADNLAGNMSIDAEGTMLDDYIRLYGNDFMSAGDSNELYEMNATMGGKERNLPVDGVAIDIGALREQYNLQYPRFAEGGLVTQTKQAFGGMI